MTPGSTGFGALPELGYLEFAATWTYPAPGFFEGIGRAHLRVWNVADRPFDYVAVVTELGEGLSVTNGVEDIARSLSTLLATDDALALGGGAVTVIEHWPADQSFDKEETYDQVAILAGRAEWRRVHPTAASNPNHRELSGWFARHRDTLERAMQATDDAALNVQALSEPPPQWRKATLQLMILIADADLGTFFTLQDGQRRQLAVLLADILAQPDAPTVHEVAERVHRAVQADTAGRRHTDPYDFLVQAVAEIPTSPPTPPLP